MSSPDYDVIIVGGGPAGVLASIGIAREGYSCVILDKKKRDKIGDKNCGDALDSLHTNILKEEMGIEPPTVESGEARSLIETITIAASDLETKLSAKTPGYQVDRLVYGQRLLKTAEDEGVDIRGNSPVRGVIIEDNQVRGVKYFNELRKLQELRAPITIDASGYIGAVRKEIPNSMSFGIDLEFPPEYTVATYREIVQLKNNKSHDFQKEIVLLYHKDIPPPGYAWIFTEGKDKLNIGITWVKSIDYPNGKSMKKIYHDVLDPLVDPNSYEILDRGGGNIPGMPNFDTLVVNGAMIVGDAGGLSDPTTFEGHGPALESGRLAAKAAVKALQGEDFSATGLWSYNKDVMTYPGSIHAQSFLVNRFIQEMGVENFAFLLGRELISEQDLIDIFQEKKEVGILLKLKIFFKSFPKWGIMWKLSQVLDKIEEIGEIYHNYPKTPDELPKWREERNRVMGYQF